MADVDIVCAANCLGCWLVLLLARGACRSSSVWVLFAWPLRAAATKASHHHLGYCSRDRWHCFFSIGGQWKWWWWKNQPPLQDPHRDPRQAQRSLPEASHTKDWWRTKPLTSARVLLCCFCLTKTTTTTTAAQTTTKPEMRRSQIVVFLYLFSFAPRSTSLCADADAAAAGAALWAGLNRANSECIQARAGKLFSGRMNAQLNQQLTTISQPLNCVR